MTIPELRAALTPITETALAERDDPDVTKAGIVLATLLGAIEDDVATDREVLDAVAITCGLICEHQIGKHPDA